MRVGDIEIDTIYGKNQLGAIVTAVDRVSWYVKLALVNSRRAEPVAKALVRILKPLRNLLHTMTADNGKEFAKHEFMAKALGVLFFFADPYSSWQRGVNEHSSGLLRQYIPKGTNLRGTTAAELQELEDRLNNRPRKALGYRTPAEVFHAGEPSQGALVS